MGQMWGASPDQLDGLGVQLTRSADRLDSIRSEVTSLLHYSHWEGVDADRFRGLWNHRLAGTLHAAAILTREGATAVRTNAQQQRDASGLGDGPGSRVGPGGRPGRQDGPVDDGFGWLGLGFGAFGLFTAPFELLVHHAKKHKDVLRRFSTDFKNTFLDNAKGLQRLAKRLGPIGVGVSALDLAYGLATGRDRGESWDDLADVGFGVAAIAATAIFPPAGIAIGLAGFAYGAYADANPGVTQRIGQDIGAAAVQTWNAVSVGAEVVGDAVENAVDMVLDPVDTARDVVSGGVNAISNLLKW